MDKLLTKTQKRQLHLIEYLIDKKKAGKYSTFSELNEVLNSTERVLKNDINYINTNLDQFHISEIEGTIFIETTENMSIETVYHFFFDKSISFNLLEYIFIHKDIEIEKLADKFFFSTPSLYRIINDTNKIIKSRYNIKIKTHPLAIGGDEEEVRYFFSQYFSEKYYFLEWPFENIEEKDIEKLIVYFHKPTNYRLEFASFEFLKTYFAITIHRIKQGYTITKKNNASYYYELYNTFSDYKEHIEYFEKKFNIKFNLETFEQLFIVFAQNNFYFTYDQMYKDSFRNDYTKKSLDFLKDFIYNMGKDFNLIIPNFDDLVLHLHNTAHLGQFEAFSNYILFNKKEVIIKFIKKSLPKLYKKAKIHIENYIKLLNIDFNETIVNHMIYTLFTHWENLYEETRKKEKELKVLVISNFDLAHPHAMLDVIKHYCSDKISFEVFSDFSLSVEWLNNSKYDVILSNFYIEGISNEKTFICSVNYDMLDIADKLNRLSAKLISF